MKKLNRRERRAKAGISKKPGRFYKIPAGQQEVKVTWSPNLTELVASLYSGCAVVNGSGYLPWYTGPRD